MSFTADRLLLFGATGDLAQRMLLPSLCALHADKLVAENLEIVGTARQPLDDAAFRNFAREALEKFMPAERRGGMATFLNRLHYQSLDANDMAGYEALAAKTQSLVAGLIAAGMDIARALSPVPRSICDSVCDCRAQAM